MNRGFYVFSEDSTNEYIEQVKSLASEKIRKERPDYILSTNQEIYAKEVFDIYSIKVPVVKFDNSYAEIEEREIPAKHFPFNYAVTEGKSYPKQVYIFKIPFIGSESFFRLKPSTGYTLSNPKIYIVDNALCFDEIDFENNVEKIKKSAEGMIESIRARYESVKSLCESFNSEVLKPYIDNQITSIREKHIENTRQRELLGFPIAEKNAAPKTYSVDVLKPKSKIVIEPTKVNKSGIPIEPTIDTETYRRILSIINDIGMSFERMPSNYLGKDEEGLRDYILTVLSSHFENASATGETFNKKGKTDILIRHNNTNLFVAECKIWRGEKLYLETMDQLLSYLTWRDSKTALIIFVKQKEISQVLKKIKDKVKEHPNYIRDSEDSSPSWFNFTLSLNGDSSKEISTAVIVYHLPI